ncbi:MAG: prolipoprotein diacylglyceryl transferase [Gemmatimonadetes bacterium]|nr:prolipoprotein diacylglyceryl transferase [Gemmatimonadota bacterium]
MIHTGFDILAALVAFGTSWAAYRRRLADAGRILIQAGPGYPFTLLIGAAVGGFALGTINLTLSDQPGIGRSILGALLGGIVAVEVYKLTRGIRGSTGLIFVPAFCTSVVVGRLGCFLAGLEDFTHGTPTALPWGWDFGDGVRRHPVQLYEAGAMVLFLALAMLALDRRSPFFQRNGFYLMTGWYALQRYAWEFLKPYGTVLARQNVFHLTAIALLLYAVGMIHLTERERV